MRWKDLVQMLGNCPIRFYKQHDPELDIQRVQTVSGAFSSAEENTVFFCRYSQLPQAPILSGAQSCLFLLLDREPAGAALWDGFCNVAAVADEAVFLQYAEAVHSVLREHRRLELAHRHLLELISDNRPLTALANTVAAIYGHYVDIIDNSLNILAISENVAPPAANLLADHQNRYVKPHVVQYLRTSGNLKKMQSSRLPVLVEDEPRDTYAYSVPLTAGAGINLGFLCVFVERGEVLSPVQLHCLPMTARLLSLEMQKSRSDVLSKSTYFTRLLSDMLQGRTPPGSTFKERFSAFSYDLRRWMNLIVLRIDPSLPASTDLPVLCRTLQGLFENSVYMMQDSTIIFLVSRHTSPELPEAQLTRWREYMQANHLRVGISDSFENPTFAAGALAQAKTALTLGERYSQNEAIHEYSRLRLLAIADQLSAAGELSGYCFPPLLRLLDADKGEDAPPLAATLRCYMEHGFSAADTCKALFIHRNTLYYRLSRIREIMGCDFTLPENAAQITLTFAILQYLGQLPR